MSVHRHNLLGLLGIFAIFWRFNWQKVEDAKITYLPNHVEEDTEDPDTSKNAPEEEEVLALPSSKASSSNPIRDCTTTEMAIGERRIAAGTDFRTRQ